MIRSALFAATLVLSAAPAFADCTDFMRREAMMFPGFKTFQPPEHLPAAPYLKPDGSLGDLTALRGKPSLVSFWFPRCPGCQYEGPSLNAMLNAYKPRGDMNFLSLSVQGKKSEVVSYLAQKGFSAIEPNIDPGAALFRELCLMATPVHVVLDAEARMIAVFVGPQDWTGEEATAFLDQLIATGGV